jgi:arsenite methyltransferase
VIGVDMTEAMLNKARENAAKNGFANVEFRRGLIEELPVDSDSVDVVTSNCVINLSPEKQKVFREAFRVLRPGGRLVVSDIVLTAPLPEVVTSNIGAYVACVAGASLRDDYIAAVRDAGFTDVEIKAESPAADALVGAGVDDPIVGAIASQFSAEEIERMAASVVSLKLAARKPVT